MQQTPVDHARSLLSSAAIAVALGSLWAVIYWCSTIPSRLTYSWRRRTALPASFSS